MPQHQHVLVTGSGAGGDQRLEGGLQPPPATLPAGAAPTAAFLPVPRTTEMAAVAIAAAVAPRRELGLDLRPAVLSVSLSGGNPTPIQRRSRSRARGD